VILRAYKTEIDPTAEQRRALAKHVAGARVAHNWVLERWIELDAARGIARGARALAGHDCAGGEAACMLGYALAALTRGAPVDVRTPRIEQDAPQVTLGAAVVVGLLALFGQHASVAWTPQKRVRYRPASGAAIPDFAATSIDWYSQVAFVRDEQPERFGWLTELSSFAIREAVIDVEDGWKHFFEHIKAGRYERAGRPRFRGRRHAAYHVDQPNPIRITSRTVTIPGIGEVVLKERDYLPVTQEKSHHFPYGGKAIALGLSERDGRWYIALRAEVPDPTPQARGPGRALRDRPVPRVKGRVAGVEVGVVNLSVATQGERSTNIRHLGLRDDDRIARFERLRKLWERRMARRYRAGIATRAQSAGFFEAKRRVAHYHARITDLRDDIVGKSVRQIVDTGVEIVRMRPAGSVHSMLSRNLTNDAQTRNRLAPMVHAARMGDVRRRVAYKMKWIGGRLEEAPQDEPVTKRCALCRTVRETSPGYPNFQCPSCGHIDDRDDNAAANLLQYSSGSDTGEAGPRSAGSKPPERGTTAVTNGRHGGRGNSPSRPRIGPATGDPPERHVQRGRSSSITTPVSEIERLGAAKNGSPQFRGDTARSLADEGNRSQSDVQEVEVSGFLHDGSRETL